jgi:hypothetical protein
VYSAKETPVQYKTHGSFLLFAERDVRKAP